MLRAALLLLFALALGGASPAAPQVAAPEPPLGILAIGDFGQGGPRERAFGRAIRRFEARNPASVLLLLGDNDYTESPTAFRRNWAAGYGWLRRASVSPAGVLGNHDVKVAGGSYELGALGMPARYYTRVVGDVELFMLDSNDVHSEQTQWLEAALARTTARWRIAVLHHPPYTCGGHEGNRRVIERWVPLFERYGVDLVLSGHDHNYQRFAPQNGVLYVLHGGGGQVLYRLRACSDATYPPRLRARRTYGFLYLVVRPDRLDGYAVRFSGRRIDRFTIGP